jgi:hypothetical protein
MTPPLVQTALVTERGLERQEKPAAVRPVPKPATPPSRFIIKLLSPIPV